MFPWLSFLSYIIIMAITPGPNNIMSMNNAQITGFRRGLVFNVGIFAGFSMVMLICLAFSTALYAVVPRIQLPMKILGAMYMLYLAIKTLLPAKEHNTYRVNSGFLIGAALQFINPKIYIYGITANSSYILPHFKSPPVLVAFAILLSFTGFVATLCWSASGSLISLFFGKYKTGINIFMAALLVYCAVSLFL